MSRQNATHQSGPYQTRFPKQKRQIQSLPVYSLKCMVGLTFTKTIPYMRSTGSFHILDRARRFNWWEKRPWEKRGTWIIKWYYLLMPVMYIYIYIYIYIYTDIHFKVIQKQQLIGLMIREVIEFFNIEDVCLLV